MSENIIEKTGVWLTYMPRDQGMGMLITAKDNLFCAWRVYSEHTRDGQPTVEFIDKTPFLTKRFEHLERDKTEAHKISFRGLVKLAKEWAHEF